MASYFTRRSVLWLSRQPLKVLICQPKTTTSLHISECHYSLQKYFSKHKISGVQTEDNFRYLSSNNFDSLNELSSIEYDQICSETLESLTDYFDEIVEKFGTFQGGDVTYSDGVLTVKLGSKFGTYVINRQTPNKQIWLSSPTSGPKRYDFITSKKVWIYKHDDQSLHSLLQSEISKILGKEVNFLKCAYSGKDMRECYSELRQVTDELVRSYALRTANHNELLATLRSINTVIQSAARLRAGRPKNEIPGLCRTALSNNNLNSLIKIIKTGLP